MADTRKKDADWLLNLDANGRVSTSDAQLAVLMDIRDELKKLNKVFACPNFLAVPRHLDDTARTLRSIQRALPVRKPRKKS